MNEVFSAVTKICTEWIENVKKKTPFEGYEWEIPINQYRYKFETGRYSMLISALDTSSRNHSYRRINLYGDIHAEHHHFIKNLKMLMVETEKVLTSYKPDKYSIRARKLIDMVGPI